MSLIENLDLDEAKEPTVVDANEEVELRIVSCRKDNNKNNEPYIMPRFEVVGDDYAKEFTKYLNLPTSNMGAKQLNQCKWGLKAFFECFRIDHTRSIDHEQDLPGETGWAIVGVGESEEYGEQNYVKKFIAPK
ncbi:hypothetical protein KAR91_34680 [Candidatus Pacearchaeota archaeon]|nr:hypothetical protein [Candidatus Pacearchaeota archaeon]